MFGSALFHPLWWNEIGGRKREEKECNLVFETWDDNSPRIVAYGIQNAGGWVGQCEKEGDLFVCLLKNTKFPSKIQQTRISRIYVPNVQRCVSLVYVAVIGWYWFFLFIENMLTFNIKLLGFGLLIICFI